MPRPEKHRFISARPGAVLYKPAGMPGRDLERVVIPLDGFEVLRLVDYEGLDQETAAQRLGVSRPTVTRILQRARQAVATALVKGAAMVIEGGTVVERPWGIQGPGPEPGLGWSWNGHGGGRGRGGGGRGGGGRRFRGGRGNGPWR
ncbi:MAG: DUF134 domain-containing protein [Planctomycetes bacterium]|nr:DUF134 domain-containing protein [Planctomycetota bacterium]